MRGTVGQMSRCFLGGFCCDRAECRFGCGLSGDRNIGLSACKKNSWGSCTSIIGGLLKKERGFRSLLLRSLAINREEIPWDTTPGAKRDGVP